MLTGQANGATLIGNNRGTAPGATIQPTGSRNSMTTIRIPGLHRVRSKGKVYLYHRATRTRIKAAPGTPEFLDEIAALGKPPEAPAKPRPSTLGALIDAYRADPEKFQRLSQRTRQDYDEVFAWLEPTKGIPLRFASRKWFKKLRKKAFAQRKRRFANYVQQVVSLLFNWCIDEEYDEGVTVNPAAKIKKIKADRNADRANRPWADDERAAAIERFRGGVLPGIALAMYAGPARQDIVRFPWSGYSGTWIEYRRKKTGKLIRLPVHWKLKEILDATPRRGLLIVLNDERQPYTVDGFYSSFAKQRDELVKAGLARPGLTIHGLRHTLGKNILDAGGTIVDVQTVLGHDTPEMSEEYSRDFDRDKRARATIRRLERQDRARVKKAGTGTDRDPRSVKPGGPICKTGTE